MDNPNPNAFPFEQADFDSLLERFDGKTISFDLQLASGLTTKGDGIVHVSAEGPGPEFTRVWIESQPVGVVGAYVDTTLSRGVVDLIQSSSGDAELALFYEA